MGYILKNTQGFIVSRLTDVGRRKISQGNFNISYFQIGDSEVNYTGVTNQPVGFGISSYMILEPQYNSQNDTGVPASTKNGVKYPFYLQNADSITYGIPFQASSVDSVFNTAAPSGPFTAITACDSIDSVKPNPLSDYSYNSSRIVALNTLNSPTNSTLTTTLSTCSLVSTNTISAGTFVTIFFQNGTDDNLCNNCFSSCTPTLTYRVINYNSGTGVLTVDRYLPNFSSAFGPTRSARLYFYGADMNYYDYPTPLNYWSSSVINFESVCTPEDGIVKVWNMNIPWSENPAGFIPGQNNDYSNFQSITYLGTKEYYGYSTSSGQTDTSGTSYYNSFDDKIMVTPEEQKAIAIVHYTNNTIINFYGEKFATEIYDNTDPNKTGQARNFVIYLPWLMWHKNSTCCSGARFYIDPPGFDDFNLLEPFYIQSTKNSDMNSPGIRYYHLYDTNPAYTNGPPNRVGKVFPDDKVIIFDDEEIVAAMSFASNRNYTLPAPSVDFYPPANSSGGLLEDDNDCLWVTYLFTTGGITDGMHCNYYQKIVGPTTGCSTTEQDVVVRFGGDFSCMVQPTISFPAGWYAKNFYVIAQKTTTGQRPSSNGWKLINFTSEFTTANGGKNAQGFISPSQILTKNFIITQSNYTSAVPYNINTNGGLVLPLSTNPATSNRVEFGDEYMFYGYLETDIEATIYEMRYLINLPGGQFLKSSNPTWTEGTTPYMTEIGLYDSDKNLMVYSKFQSPQIRQGIQQAVVKLDF
jgi:hypothetical protein